MEEFLDRIKEASEIENRKRADSDEMLDRINRMYQESLKKDRPFSIPLGMENTPSENQEG